MTIRFAIAEDVSACVTMIETFRDRLQTYQPRFWNKSAISAQMTQAFFGDLATDARATFLVSDGGAGIDGFLIAMPQQAPPVFDPGGPTALIDDFCVASPDLWPTTGAALLDEARRRLREAGFAQIVVVMADRDTEKNAFIRATDLSLASTWWTAAT